MPLGETVGRFQELFVRNLVAKSAENAFKGEVRKFCTNFQAKHVQLAAESGKPFSEIIAMSGYKVQPTPVDKLNPWQRHLVSLPDVRLIELVKEATSPAHGQMLDKYPQVAYGLVRAIKGMVVAQDQGG